MQTSAPLDLPRATRRYRFSMTALADVMFQLLVFFMLSSNVTPYAFLTVQSGGLQGGVVGAAPDRPDGLLTQAGTTAVWTLSPGGIVASGQQFPLERLDDLSQALALQHTQHLLLVIRPEVSVQMTVTVLEHLAAHGVSAVQIAGGGLP